MRRVLILNRLLAYFLIFSSTAFPQGIFFLCLWSMYLPRILVSEPICSYIHPSDVCIISKFVLKEILTERLSLYFILLSPSLSGHKHTRAPLEARGGYRCDLFAQCFHLWFWQYSLALHGIVVVVCVQVWEPCSRCAGC